MIAVRPPEAAVRDRVRRSGAPVGLVAAALAVGVLFILPAVFVAWRTVELGAELAEVWSEVRAPLIRTVLLAAATSATAAVVGTGLAVVLDRTDVPGRGVLRVLLVLPLVFPSFVGATAVVTSLAPGGVTEAVLGVVGVDPPRRFRGFVPAWIVLTMFTYPYVLLSVSARLQRTRTSLEESARLLGTTAFGAFRRVTLPQIQPAIVAGSMLVFLYTVSDYGAVQILGYDTLTRVVFATLLADQALSFSAAAAVVLLAWVAAATERRSLADGDTAAAFSGEVRRVALGRWRLPVLGVAWGVVVAALVMPALTLVVWSARGLAGGRVDLGDLVGPAVTTSWVGLVTGVLAMLVVMPVAVLGVRHTGRVGRLVGVFVIGGFALPGAVIALALVFWALSFPGASVVYQTLPLLLVAYVVHFGAQALGAGEGAVRAVPIRLSESARLLEASPVERWRRVHLPLMRPGLTAGAGLVLLSTVKELPATLLLGPTGFETLATEVWGSFGEGFYAEAATASLLLVGVSGVLTWLLVLRGAGRAPRASGFDQDALHHEGAEPHHVAVEVDRGGAVG